MAESKIINTNRLTITPFSENHISNVYIDWLNDKNIVRYSEQRHRTHSVDTCRNYLKSFEKSSNYFWAVISNENHIGNINAYVDEKNEIADVGIMIGNINYWGKGYATEAFKAICDFLFKELKMRKVTAGTISLNKGMLKIMKNVGMYEEAVKKRHYLCEGEEVDVVHMALFKDDWQID